MTNADPKVSCPCCGYITIPKGTVKNFNSHGFICPICFWEIDTFINSEKDISVSNHGMTLAKARENFKTIGAVQKRLVQFCRKPNENELPDSHLT